MLCTHLTKAFSMLHHQLPQKDSLQRLPHPPALKVFHINVQSLREKKLQFFSFVELNKPDIIVGTETYAYQRDFWQWVFPTRAWNHSLSERPNWSERWRNNLGKICPFPRRKVWIQLILWKPLGPAESCWIQVSFDRCLLQTPWIWSVQPRLFE